MDKEQLYTYRGETLREAILDIVRTQTEEERREIELETAELLRELYDEIDPDGRMEWLSHG